MLLALHLQRLRAQQAGRPRDSASGAAPAVSKGPHWHLWLRGAGTPSPGDASARCTHVQRGGRVTPHQVLHPQCPKAPTGTYGSEAQAHPRREMHLTGALTSSGRAGA